MTTLEIKREPRKRSIKSETIIMDIKPKSKRGKKRGASDVEIIGVSNKRPYKWRGRKVRKIARPGTVVMYHPGQRRYSRGFKRVADEMHGDEDILEQYEINEGEFAYGKRRRVGPAFDYNLVNLDNSNPTPALQPVTPQMALPSSVIRQALPSSVTRRALPSSGVKRALPSTAVQAIEGAMPTVQVLEPRSKKRRMTPAIEYRRRPAISYKAPPAIGYQFSAPIEYKTPEAIEYPTAQAIDYHAPQPIEYQQAPAVQYQAPLAIDYPNRPIKKARYKRSRDVIPLPAPEVEEVKVRGVTPTEVPGVGVQTIDVKVPVAEEIKMEVDTPATKVIYPAYRPHPSQVGHPKEVRTRRRRGTGGRRRRRVSRKTPVVYNPPVRGARRRTRLVLPAVRYHPSIKQAPLPMRTVWV